MSLLLPLSLSLSLLRLRLDGPSDGRSNRLASAKGFERSERKVKTFPCRSQSSLQRTKRLTLDSMLRVCLTAQTPCLKIHSIDQKHDPD